MDHFSNVVKPILQGEILRLLDEMGIDPLQRISDERDRLFTHLVMERVASRTDLLYNRVEIVKKGDAP